jgi:hypothetical protein
MSVTLSEPFAFLQPFVEKWAKPTEEERFFTRINTPLEETRTFYDVIQPRVTEIGDYLNDKPVRETLSPEDFALFNLAASYIEVSRCFEAWDARDVRADFFEPAQIVFS